MRYLLTFLSLLCCLHTFAQNSAPTYNHDKIAILPFRVESYRTPKRDTSLTAFNEQELAKGLECQQQLYKTLTADDNRLLVEIQDWEITDSLLRKAQVDFRKIHVLDPSKLCKLLGVDAVMVAEIKEKLATTYNGGPAYDRYTPYTNPGSTGPRMYLHLSFFDGKTGHKIWNYEDLETAFRWDSRKRLDKSASRVFKEVRAKFPYTKK